MADEGRVISNIKWCSVGTGADGGSGRAEEAYAVGSLTRWRLLVTANSNCSTVIFDTQCVSAIIPLVWVCVYGKQMHLVEKTTNIVIWYNLLILASQVIQEDFKSCPFRSIQLITTAGNEGRVLSSESFLETQLFLIPFHRKEYQFLFFTLHGLFWLFTWEPSAQATNRFYTLEAKMPSLKPDRFLLTLFSKSWYLILLRKRVHNMWSSGSDDMQDLCVV